MSDYIVFGRPDLSNGEIEEVIAAIRSGWIGTGPRTAKFEQEFAEYVGAKHAIAVNSCTAALHLSLLALGVGPGHEVVTTPMTFAATANVVEHIGAKPVFVDVDPLTMNIDAEQLASAITSATRAILPVHFAGRPCHLDEVRKIALRHQIPVVEDAAHCIEGQYRGRKIGTVSELTCFSFYVTKNMTTAEGGMICTEDDELAQHIRVNSLHGLSKDAWKRFSDDGYRHYEIVSPGFKYNMTDLQAAIGLVQLRQIDRWLTRREEIWQAYDQAFRDFPVVTPAPAEPESRHARHLYTLLVDPEKCGLSRDQFMQELHRQGIGTGVHYRAVHLHRYYREKYGFQPEDFPVATRISEETVSLPLSGGISDDEVDRIIQAVRGVLAGKLRVV